MQKTISKNNSIWGLGTGAWGLVIVAVCLLSLSGCVTAPTRDSYPVYKLNGTTYLALIPLCESRGISWEYDTFTRTVVLKRDAHRINLMVGDELVLVDGSPQHLRHPVDIYQGTVVVPTRFKEQVIDALFKESYLPGRSSLAPLKIKKIVIDAGHGGKDPGAIGRSGLKEKDVNLDVAKHLSKLLRAQGIEVAMTRTTDSFISLPSRVDIANGSGAELFLSIHSNANHVRGINGFEVYYVSPTVGDSKRALSAAQEATLDLDSSCFASQSTNLKATLWDMIYTHSRAESIKLARHICQAIRMSLDTKILGIKNARFYVLKGVRMPAILVEIGYLSNHNEERMLKNGYYRQKIAEGIASGLKSYARDLTLAQTLR